MIRIVTRVDACTVSTGEVANATAKKSKQIKFTFHLPFASVCARHNRRSNDASKLKMQMRIRVSRLESWQHAQKDAKNKMCARTIKWNISVIIVLYSCVPMFSQCSQYTRHIHWMYDTFGTTEQNTLHKFLVVSSSHFLLCDMHTKVNLVVVEVPVASVLSVSHFMNECRRVLAIFYLFRRV